MKRIRDTARFQLQTRGTFSGDWTTVKEYASLPIAARQYSKAVKAGSYGNVRVARVDVFVLPHDHLEMISIQTTKPTPAIRVS